MDVSGPLPMSCPRCRQAGIAPHPESSALVGLYACCGCQQEWTAHIHGDAVTLTFLDGGHEPKTVTTSLKDLNTAIIERLR